MYYVSIPQKLATLLSHELDDLVATVDFLSDELSAVFVKISNLDSVIG